MQYVYNDEYGIFNIFSNDKLIVEAIGRIYNEEWVNLSVSESDDNIQETKKVNACLYTKYIFAVHKLGTEWNYYTALSSCDKSSPRWFKLIICGINWDVCLLFFAFICMYVCSVCSARSQNEFVMWKINCVRAICNATPKVDCRMCWRFVLSSAYMYCIICILW